jgi:hypothetical protein
MLNYKIIQILNYKHIRDEAQLILDDLRRTGPSTAVPDLLEAQPTTEGQVEGNRILSEANRMRTRQERLEEQRDRIQSQIDVIYGRELNRLTQANQQLTADEVRQALEGEIRASQMDPDQYPITISNICMGEQGVGAEQNRNSRVFFDSRINAIDATN